MSVNHNQLRCNLLNEIELSERTGLRAILLMTTEEARAVYSALCERAIRAVGCLGYPECDADLEGETHSEMCGEMRVRFGRGAG